MILLVLGAASLLFGVATALFTTRLVRFELQRSTVAEGAMVIATALMLVAAVIGFESVHASGLAVLFIGAVAAVTALVLLRIGQMPLLGPVTSALAGMVCLALALHLGWPDRPPPGVVGPVTILHVTATLVGYLLFAPAFVLGNLYVAQSWRLKTKQLQPTRLPPLATLEQSAWRLLTLGFVLYTLGIVGGWLSSGTNGAVRPQHVVAAISWLVYAVALGRRYLSGWGGVRAAVTLLAGFVVTSGAVLLYMLR